MKKYFGLFLLFILLISGFVFADSNGIWHFAKDVRPGVFGSDEGGGDFIFTGRVGIGTTNPKSILHVDGVYKDGSDVLASDPHHASYAIFDDMATGYSGGFARHISLSFDGESAARLGIHGSSTSGSITSSNFYINVNKSEVLAWSTPDFVIEDSGNVGIGTINPSAKLHVAGNIIASNPTANNHVATKSYVDSVAGGSISFSNCAWSSCKDAPHEYICPSGKVVVGVSIPSMFTGDSGGATCGNLDDFRVRCCSLTIS